MAKLSAAEQFVLKKLIRAGRLDVKQAEGLVQVLNIERMEDPDVELADVLVKRKVASESEVNELLWDAQTAESEAAPAAATPRPQRRSPRPAAPASRTPSRRTTSMPILIVGILFWVVVGAGVAYYLNQKKAEEEAQQQQNAEVAEKESGTAPPVKKSPSRSSEPPKRTVVEKRPDPVVEEEDEDAVVKISVAAAEARLVKALRHPTPAERIRVLSELLEVCPAGSVRDDVKREHKSQLERANIKAEVKFDRRRKELSQLENSMQLRDAQGIYAEFLAEYGPEVLHGTFKNGYDRIKKQRAELVERHWKEGKRAFETNNFELARRTFRKMITYADAEDIARAKDYLSRIEKIAGTENLLSDKELADVEKRSKERKERKTNPEPEDEPVAEPPADPEEEKWRTELGKRVRKIADRLGELFSTETATLEADGRITFRYEFSQKRFEDADDWNPPLLEVVDTTKPARWTQQREEVYHRTGVKIGDAGVLIHKALLRPPFKMKASYWNMTSFQQKNMVMVSWVSKKGKGVGGNFGRQCVSIGRFRGGKRQPSKLPPLGAEREYQFEIYVDAGGKYSTSGSGHKAGPAKLPKKMESGYAALVWGGSIAGVVTEVTIEGVLDLEWAEKELGL